MNRQQRITLGALFAFALLSLSGIASAQNTSYSLGGGYSAVCYQDGCVNFNFTIDLASLSVYGNTTVAQTMATAINAALAAGDRIPVIETNSIGNLQYIGCGNGHTHALIYDCTYQYSCSGNNLVDYCGGVRTCPSGCANGQCLSTTTRTCFFGGQTLSEGQSVTAYKDFLVPVGTSCASETRTCHSGVLSGSYTHGSCSQNICPVYTCSGNTIIEGCSGATVASCQSPSFCTSGSSSCIVPSLQVSGPLQARPSLVKAGQTTHLFWSVLNAKSCTVSGQNGDSWALVSSGDAGVVSGPVNQQTTFTLNCLALPGASPASLQQSATVNIIPSFQEI